MITGRSLLPRAVNGVQALARLTMFEATRLGFAPLAFLAYAVFAGLLGNAVELEAAPARSRYLDQAFSAAAAGLVLVAVVMALQFAARRQRVRSGDGSARRLLGDAGHFWGRGLGIVAILSLLGLAVGLALVVNVGIRFGDIAGEEEPLRTVAEATNFGDARELKFVRPRGEAAMLEFDLDSTAAAVAQLEFRFAPRLVLVGETAEIRSSCPLAFVLRDPDGRFSRRRVFGIHEGKPIRFALELPAEGIRRLEVRVENLSPNWLIKFRAENAVILGERRSLAAGIMRGGLILGLYAACFALIALFLRAFVGNVSALILALALALVSGSLDLFEDGLLNQLQPVLRDVIMAGLRVLLPDFDRCDVAAMMVRGLAPSWGRVIDLLARLGLEAGLLGLLVKGRAR